MKRLVGCLLLFASLAFTALVRAQDTADRIWSGGPILTMNDDAMRAEAVAERGGRIVAVGSATEVMKLRGPRTQLIDLQGRAMLPGFIDGHGHVLLGGLQALSANLLAPPDGGVKSIADLQKTLRDWAAANADAVRQANLILGFGYDNSQLAEQRHPTREELDAVSTDVPVVVVHQSAHLATLNSKALAIVGYDSQSKDPAGGVIRRKEGSSDPNGVLEETAWMSVVPKLFGAVGVRGLKAFARAGSELWARYGYTTAQEGRAVPATAAVLKQVADEGGLTIDVVAYSDVLANRDFITVNMNRRYANRFRVGGGKLTIDGSPQGFTAWRDRPFYQPVGDYPPGYVGYPAIKPEQAVDALDWAYRNNVQILVHSSGEAAADLLIASVQAARARHGGGDRRTVLIHGHFQREDQVDAFARLGVFSSLFPMHTFYWGDWHRDRTVGPELADNISPTGWLVKRGLKFTSHHDAPVAFPDSMRVLDATVTRRTRSGDILGPAQRVDVITALKSLTIWAAYQHFEEGSKGSIEPGKLADLVILTRDPTAVSPTMLADIKVTETIKEGRTIFALDSEQQKRAQLMLGARGGEQSFARFLNAASAYRDFAQAPSYLRQFPGILLALTDVPHDPACVSRFLDGLVEAMLADARGSTVIE